jgi:hypothetical protein
MYEKNTAKQRKIDGLYLLATVVLAFLMMESLRADDTYWGLIVHGGGTTHASYDNGVLRVEFRHSLHPAGDSLHYESQVPAGQAAWPDRSMSPNEPSVLLQRVSEDEAARIIEHLNARGYWEFYCRNTGKGFFDVSHSKLVRASVRIDYWELSPVCRFSQR